MSSMKEAENTSSDSSTHQRQRHGPDETYYRVYEPEIDSVAHDPLDPAKRYHDGLWIEHDPGKELGKLFNVTGDVLAANGMYYEEKIGWAPSQIQHLHALVFVGHVLRADYDSGRIAEILRGLPTPPKQQGIDFWHKDPITGRHGIIWTHENGEPYINGKEQRPVFKCNEWTAHHAIPALRDAGILLESV